MNYIKHLTGFFERVAIDKTLNPTHISLYIALFQFWNCNRFKNPISISRDEIMRISKISSKATYHKCLKNLHALGYIKYEPSFNPFKGSHVYLFNFADDLKPIPKSEKTTLPKNEPIISLVTELVVDKSYTSNETSSEQALVPYINNKNIPNNSNDLKIVNLDEQAKKIEENDFNFKIENSKEEKSSVKKEEKEMPEPELDKRTESTSPAFADYNAEHTETSRQKSFAKKEKEEMPDAALEKRTESHSPAFADYNTEHTKNSRLKSFAKKEEKEMLEPELDKRTESSSLAFANYNAEHTETSRQKSSAKKEKDITNDFVIPSAVDVSQLKNEKPTIENVKSYFQENKFPELEAQKFFNYFSSVGWLVGGKTPMVDWQAAAQNWILNSINFNHNTDTIPTYRPKQLNTTTKKNYAEPL